MKMLDFDQKWRFGRRRRPKFGFSPSYWGGEWKKLTNFGTQLGEENINLWNMRPRWGGERLILPLPLWGAIIDGFGLLLLGGRIHCFGGEISPPRWGGEWNPNPSSCIWLHILPPTIFRLVSSPPLRPSFGGENAPMLNSNDFGSFGWKMKENKRKSPEGRENFGSIFDDLTRTMT